MDLELEPAPDEIKRLQRCINDLISVLALPAIWSGRDPLQVVHSLLDALLRMLQLDFVYVKLKKPEGEAPMQHLRVAESQKAIATPAKICDLLDHLFGGDPQVWPASAHPSIGDRTVSLLPLQMGLQGELGLIVAGSQRTDFPTESEKLVLSVAANQGSIGLQEARLRGELKRLNSDLDNRVAQRTTELRDANAQVARGEERWRSVFENSAVGVALTDLNGRFIATNPVYQKMLGYTGEELQNLSFLDITHEKYVEPNWTLVGELLEGKRQQFQIEKQYRRKDGKSVWVRNNVSLVPGTQRVPRFIMALSEDISERKQAEEALRERERSFRRIFDGIGGLVAIMTGDGQIDFVNKQLLEYFGKTVEELKSWATSDAIHPDDLPSVIAAWNRSLQTGSPYEVDHRLRRADGVYRWFHARGLSLCDAESRIVRWYILVTDIDDRKKAEEGLRRSERDLHEAQRLAHLGSWKLDLLSGQVTVSPEIFRIYNANPEENISNSDFWFGRIHSEDRQRVREHFETCVAQRLYYEADYRIVHPDGTIRYQHAIGHPILSASGTPLEFLGTAMDVTEQVQARIALQKAFDEIEKSEDQLRAIINTIPTSAWSTRPDGYCDFLNERWLDYAGMTAEQAQGWGWGAAVHPDDREQVVEYWQSCLASGMPAEMEARLLRSDGAYRWFLFRANPLRDESGKIVRWYGTNIDIDDRKRGEEALRASERSLTLNINAMPTLLASARPDGWGDFFNQRWLDYTGLSAEQLEGWGWATPLHPDDAEQLLTSWRSSLVSGAPLEAEARMRRFDGTYRWMLFRADALRDESGEIVKWFGNAVDIESRKKAEEGLRRSEASLAEAQNLARIGNFSWLVATDEIKWSEQLYRIFEFEPGVLITLDLIGSRVHPEDLSTMYEMIEKSRRGASDFEYEHRIVMPDRSIKRLHLIAHAHRDRDGRLEYIGAVQDITQRWLAEEAVAKARTELANMARVTSLGMLTASIAHEVNQPLFGIITNASTCLSMLSADPPDVDAARETARRTIRDGNRASDVIKRLRTLYGKKDPTPESMDLNESTREVISLLLSDLQRRGVILRQELSDDLPVLMADRVQLQQVIMNLLRNAADAMRDVVDRPRELLIRTEREEGDRVRLSVKDAGGGFAPQAADRLFEAFYTTKNEGMGIGLSISRSIIEAHQGRLWATANDGPGATVSFSIPTKAGGSEGGQTSGSEPDDSANAA
jgi:PAS domain S-box-containing protein